MTAPTIPPRPKLRDAAILRAAAAQLAPKVKEWCGGDDTSLALADIEEDLVKAIAFHDDGYDIAKFLDGHSYFPDAALVEILDEAFGLKRAALTEAETAWVTAHNIQPIPLETPVRWSRAPKNAGVGIVTANHPDGKSTVMFKALGHVREGLGVHGHIIEWELLEVVPA